MDKQDKEILRALAARVAELAAKPENARKREAWYIHNDLQPGRPLVLCFPEGSWPELVSEGDLHCEDKEARALEYDLRRRLYWHEVLRDDAPEEARFDVYPAVDLGNFGVQTEYTHGDNRGSYRWEPPIKDLDADLDQLWLPEPSHDAQETARRFTLAHELFDGILTVALRPGLDFWTMGLTSEAIALYGLDNLLFSLADNPDGVCRLMAFLRDAKLKVLDWYEANATALLAGNNLNGYTGSGGLAYTHAFDPVTPPNPLWPSWGFAESQETVGVSPKMFRELILPYQMPLLQRFGLNCYGCCEPVHQRIEDILRIPRLRRLSVSPWCDQRTVAERTGRNIVFSRKPNPALICAGFHEDAARADIVSTLEQARDCNVELIMKDTHTVENQPWRLARWVEIAREEIGRRFD